MADHHFGQAGRGVVEQAKNGLLGHGEGVGGDAPDSGGVEAQGAADYQQLTGINQLPADRQQDEIEHSSCEENSENQTVTRNQELEFAAIYFGHMEQIGHPEAQNGSGYGENGSLHEQHERSGFDNGGVSLVGRLVFVVN